MNQKIKFELSALSDLMHLHLYIYDESSKVVKEAFFESAGQQQAVLDIINDAKQESFLFNVPYVCQDMKDIYFGIVKAASEYIIVGPVSVGNVNFSRRWEYSHKHQLGKDEEILFSKMEYRQFIQLLILISHIAEDTVYTYEQIIAANQLTVHQEPVTIANTLVADDLEHHTYKMEREWANAMTEGDRDRAKKIFGGVIGSEGKLSKDAVTHSRYMYVVMITIATRIALENGVIPALAYGLSDELINRVDRCQSVMDVNAMYMEAIDRIADTIKDAQNKKKYSNYLEQCKQYIDQNYKEKLSLESLAEYTGLNPTYLSHLFSQLEQMTINEYINKLRVERAQNLLKYSNQSIIAIGDYVGFQSQSYFGKIFKKYSGSTPGKYRTQFQIKEFRKDSHDVFSN